MVEWGVRQGPHLCRQRPVCQVNPRGGNHAGVVRSSRKQKARTRRRRLPTEDGDPHSKAQTVKSPSNPRRDTKGGSTVTAKCALRGADHKAQQTSDRGPRPVTLFEGMGGGGVMAITWSDLGDLNSTEL